MIKKLLVLTALCGALTACTDLTESEDNSQETMYRFGQVVTIKKGFYREYGCVVLREYKDSIFCKIVVTPDGQRVAEDYQVRENFQKSNVQLVEEPKQSE